MFGWWRNWKRKQILKQPLPYALRERALEVWQWRYLPKSMQDTAIDWMKLFIAWRHWEGCNGLQLTPEMQWTIASQASLMTLAYPDWFFDNVPTVLLYPEAYVAPQVPQAISGDLTMVSDSARHGEAWYRGPVILNWRDVHQSARGPHHGQHLVAHEFAHQMDMANSRTADGIPPLPLRIDAEVWRRRFEDELQLARDYVASGHRVLISDYGLSSPGEFFAVSSELYFQVPHDLAHFHPVVYELLWNFYQHDFRQWLPTP